MIATMTKAERLELSKVARMNAAVAKKELEARGAEQLAQIEVQLARVYTADHEAFVHITAKANAIVEKANEEIRKIARKMKVPDTFAPEFNCYWSGRGENADQRRRSELRRAAEAQVEANVKTGKVKIDRQVAVICTQLVAEGLTTEKAKGFLESLPKIDELLPMLTLPDLEQTKSKLNAEDRLLVDY